MAKTSHPDVILMDINIAGKIDGIDTARIILEDWSGPIIFLTAYSDKDYVAKAKALLPAAYLLKPIILSQFGINLEIAIHNFFCHSPIPVKQSAKNPPESIFISINQVYHKIMKSDILFIEASGSYININTVNQKILISTNLKSIEKQLDDPSFVRVHCKYLININKVDRIDGSSLRLSQYPESVPIGDNYKQLIYAQFQLIKTK